MMRWHGNIIAIWLAPFARAAFQWGGSSDWEGLHRSEFGLQEFLLTHAKPIPHSPFEDAPNRYETNLPAAKKSWKMH
jgi:hypothetical protein